MASDSQNIRNCPLCRKKTKTTRLKAYERDDWRIVKCGTCAMIYIENAPPQDVLFDEQAWEKNHRIERERRRANRRLYYFFSDAIKALRVFLRRFRRHSKEIRYIMRFSQGTNVLDVGCGDGNALTKLPPDFTPYGIEPSPGLQARAHAAFEKRGGACIREIAIKGFAALPDTKYHLIVMLSFLEHDTHAFETLKAARKALAKDAAILIKVPNMACWQARLRKANWPGMRYPDHVNYFTPTTLRALLNLAGFSRVDMPLHWRLATSDNMWCVAHRIKYESQHKTLQI